MADIEVLETDITKLEIAYALGYAESGAFHRLPAMDRPDAG